MSSASHIIDELIDERAKTLRSIPYLWQALRLALNARVKYPQAKEWADRLGPRDADSVMRELLGYLDLDLRVSGLDNVPESGAAIILANHPTGWVDGLALHQAITRVRPDVMYLANRDAIRLVPALDKLIIPVEWLKDRRSRHRMTETFRKVKEAFARECLVVIFPAGAMAKLTWRGLRERDWFPTPVKFIARYAVAAIPVHIAARNSWMYYAFSLVHEELRDLTRFSEFLNKKGRPFTLTFGAPLPVPGAAEAAEDLIAAYQDFIEFDLPRGRAFDAGGTPGPGSAPAPLAPVTPQPRTP